MEMNYDINTLHELEQELQTEILPGTEIMTDVGSHHFIKASATSSRVLVPQPSLDPDDPLNWSPRYKFYALLCATSVSFGQAFGPLALGPMFGYFIKDFHSDLASVVQFTGVCILVLGFSNFIWVPAMTSWGRRPVLIFSMAICCASNIWRAKARSYGSFMGACVLNGLGAGPAETFQPTVIADMMFLHERGKYNTLYFVSYFGGLMVGPIVAGPMAEKVGWRAFWWLNVALLAFFLVLSIFLFPETKWHRRRVDDAVASASPIATKGEKLTETDEKVSPAPDPAAEDSSADPYLGKGRPSKQQFKLWQPKDPNESLFTALWTPLKLFAFPIVEFASFVVSWSASFFLTLNLTQSQAFAAPPYNFSSLKIGFFNFAILVGALIGLFTAGPLSDWISMRLTVRNRGIREPEMRLPSMIPYVLIMIFGNAITAVGYQHSWDWKIIVFLGYTSCGIQVAALPAIASTYAVDSYKPVTGSIFVAITVNKNLWGYGFSKFITPWIIKAGYVPPIMTNMALTVLWCAFGVIFWFWGKSMRRWTRGSKVHSM